ncbi:MAG: heme exporter protein [Acidimicrobiaceae bacterium]|nr:heme exporter protein [Acidimicrobiaceae bacterium]MDQ1400294.1 heme exporter protein [Acidimicrobiaceae bacterium]
MTRTERSPAKTGTGNRTTRLLGAGALVASAGVLYFGLVTTPADEVQGDLVRLIYIHPAVSTMAFVAFGVTALASLLYLYPRTRSWRWDRLAGASGEVGVVFCALSLATGSIWGRPAWGVWWTWDARLTLTALLCALFVGYLALRRTGGGAESRAIRSAVAGVLFAVVVPIDHFATEWWRTLHQGDTLATLHPKIHGSQLWTMLLSFIAFGLIYAWLMFHRTRLEQLESRLENEGLAYALAARRAEGAPSEPEAGPETAPVSGPEAAAVSGSASGESAEAAASAGLQS